MFSTQTSYLLIRFNIKQSEHRWNACSAKDMYRIQWRQYSARKPDNSGAIWFFNVKKNQTAPVTLYFLYGCGRIYLVLAQNIVNSLDFSEIITTKKHFRQKWSCLVFPRIPWHSVESETRKFDFLKQYLQTISIFNVQYLSQGLYSVDRFWIF